MSYYWFKFPDKRPEKDAERVLVSNYQDGRSPEIAIYSINEWRGSHFRTLTNMKPTNYECYWQPLNNIKDHRKTK